MSRGEFDLTDIFARIPLLNQYHPDDFEIQTLAGYTNRNYRLKNHEHDWVLRIPKQQTNRFINRNHEAHNLALAVSMGLAIENQWHDESGLSLTTTLSQTRTAKAQDLNHYSTVERLLTAVHRLHESNPEFLGELDLSHSLNQYYDLIPTTNMTQLKPLYQKALQSLDQLEEKHINKVPSHSDLVLENLLIEDTGKIWMIDWEYSAMASPYWDLATICNTARLNRKQSQDLLSIYNAPGSTLELSALLAYRFALQLLTICWMLTFSHAEIASEIRHLTRLQV